MTFRETAVVFAEEISRLESERETLAEEIVAMDASNPQRQRKAQRGNEIDTFLDGLEWAQNAHDDEDIPQWDEDVDRITLSGLTGGEFGALEGEVSDMAGGDTPAAQVERVAKVRLGTVDAPYLESGQSKSQATAAVAGLPVGFLRWAGSRIDELSSVGNGERSDFASLLAEKQSKQ